MTNSKCKILVAYHKKSKLFKDEVFFPIHAGRKMSKNSADYNWLCENMQGDDTFENISEQNPYYCELSAIYWAWKNQECLGNPNYIGLCHYRRLFKFSKRTLKEDLQNNDVLLTKKLFCFSKIANAPVENVRSLWLIERKIEDLKFIYNRVKNYFPEYTESFDKVLLADCVHCCNMFIMKVELFNKYCEWLFKILDVDINNFREKPRIKGYLGEILLNVFIVKHFETLKIKELDCKYYNPNKKKKSILQHIFSVTNEIPYPKRYKVITILGIKFKIQVKNKMFYHLQQGNLIEADALYLAFIKTINKEDFLLFVENYIKNTPEYKLVNDEYLIYISLLVDLNQKEKAKEELEKYIKKFGYCKLYSFCNVGNFAKECGIDNILINESAEIYKYTCSNESIKKLRETVNGKTIAIVGNGPSEIGKGKGAEIDSHDLVIRINNFKTKGFENDYGTKTDIWARGLASDVEDKTKDSSFIACIWAADIPKFNMRYSILKILTRDLKNEKLKTIILDEKTATEIKINSKIQFPTTGLNTICCILNNTNPKKVDYYGFSFLQEKSDGYATHYFNDRTKKEAIYRSNVHSFNSEAYYLAQICSNNKELICSEK